MPLKNNHIPNSVALDGYCFVASDDGNIEENRLKLETFDDPIKTEEFLKL